MRTHGPPPAPTARPLIPSLSAVRVPAMVVVLLFHTVDNLAGPRLWHIPGSGPFITNGSVALTLFFFLSGFLLTMGWAPSMSLRRFYVRRVARIYPLYLVAWCFAILVDLLKDDPLPSPSVAVATLLLVQSLIPSQTYYFGVDIVFWSLSCEALFYLVLPFFVRWVDRLPTRGLWAVLGGCWAWLAFLPLAVAAVADESAWRTMTQSPFYRFSEFAAGVTACLLVRRTRAPRVRVWQAGGAVLALYAGTSLLIKHLVDADVNINGARLLGPILCFPAVALLIVVLATRNARGESGLFSGRGWVRAGDWTYAVYLFHVPLLILLYPPLTRTASVGSGLAQLAAYSLVVIVVAGAMHEWVLVPAERYLKRRWDPRPSVGEQAA